ncbi:hypothetical protein FVEG_02034 [Fusarium verticillioides 7600]|uniref:Uncharacterized protein n=1 Tax=Gibberella moniliformis (strain M3125 / FGSC 7600) TaxID=334819 RepID=W7LKI4_GIBM7|nr:hypothetical protein FVEG_02034 [Fusarium verticillioides 7600]EWG39011.1 hypothetical protein FVEG_02034 [Fusarium verticillioides 7600]
MLLLCHFCRKQLLKGLLSYVYFCCQRKRHEAPLVLQNAQRSMHTRP